MTGPTSPDVTGGAGRPGAPAPDSARGSSVSAAERRVAQEASAENDAKRVEMQKRIQTIHEEVVIEYLTKVGNEDKTPAAQIADIREEVKKTPPAEQDQKREDLLKGFWNRRAAGLLKLGSEDKIQEDLGGEQYYKVFQAREQAEIDKWKSEHNQAEPDDATKLEIKVNALASVMREKARVVTSLDTDALSSIVAVDYLLEKGDFDMTETDLLKEMNDPESPELFLSLTERAFRLVQEEILAAARGDAPATLGDIKDRLSALKRARQDRYQREKHLAKTPEGRMQKTQRELGEQKAKELEPTAYWSVQVAAAEYVELQRVQEFMNLTDEGFGIKLDQLKTAETEAKSAMESAKKTFDESKGDPVKQAAYLEARKAHDQALSILLACQEAETRRNEAPAGEPVSRETQLNIARKKAGEDLAKSKEEYGKTVDKLKEKLFDHHNLMHPDKTIDRDNILKYMDYLKSDEADGFLATHREELEAIPAKLDRAKAGLWAEIKRKKGQLQQMLMMLVSIIFGESAEETTGMVSEMTSAKAA